jgi:hypothetical protein
MAVLLPHGAFLTEDRLTLTLETAEPLGVSPPEAVDLLWIKVPGSSPRITCRDRGPVPNGVRLVGILDRHSRRAAEIRSLFEAITS